MNERTNSTGRSVKIGRIPQILLWEDGSCSSEPHFRLACNHFSNAPWVLTGSSALHCKCLALVLSLALKHSWFTYSLFIAFWALSPGSSALGWTGFSCSSWNIVMYQQAGFTFSGLGWPDVDLKKKKERKRAPCTWFLSLWETSDIQGCFLHSKWFPNEWFHFTLCTEKLPKPRN